MKRWLKWVVPVVVVALGVGGVMVMERFRPRVEPQPTEVALPVVEVMEVVEEVVTLQVGSQGSARPVRSTQLIPQVGGRVVAVASGFVEGGHVEAGEELIRLEALDYELALAEAEQRAAQARLVLAEEEARAVQAERDWAELGRGGEAPPLVRREPQLAQARAAVVAAEALVAAARRDLERTVLLAPYAGRVREKRVEEGEFVSKRQVLGVVYDGSAMEVALPLGQADLARLGLELGRGGRLERPLAVELSAHFGGETVKWQGAIRRTGAVFDEATRTLELIAEVQPGGEDLPLLPGQFVRATIAGRQIERGLRVPRVAMRGFDEVSVVTAEDRINLRRVVAVSEDEESVVVVEGLRAGEWVSVTPLQVVMEGMRVQRLETTTVGAGEEKP